VSAAPDRVFYGRIEAMVAEVGALDMGAWCAEHGYTHCVLPDGGDVAWDTSFHTLLEDARAEAREVAERFTVPMTFVA
jgi:hypothetical protein